MLGVNDFLIFNLPDLGLTPAYLEAPESLRMAAAAGKLAYNARLDTVVAGLRADGLAVSTVDLFNLFTQLRADPAAFGLSDVRTPCVNPMAGTVCTHAEVAERAFFDLVHPSAPIHAVIGEDTRAALAPVPLPATALLLIAAFGALGAKRTRRAAWGPTPRLRRRCGCGAERLRLSRRRARIARRDREDSMSHTFHPLRRARLQRSTLAVPASNQRMIAKAADSDADVVMLDLEDAVAPTEKEQARENAVAALLEIDWAARAKAVSVRINGLDTPWMYRDVIAIVENAGERVDTLMIPKLGLPADLYMVDTLVSQIEQAGGRPARVGLEALIETALGMANVEAIAAFAAASSPRLEALHFGVGDYAASLRARTMVIGGQNPDYPGDMWHAGLSRLIVACRAHGLRAVDGPYGDFSDVDGYRAAARRAAALGCEGKWAIHPAQIALANAEFSPTEAEVAQAERMAEAVRTAEADGRGAAALDGRMIDAASARMAETVLRMSRAIAARGGV